MPRQAKLLSALVVSRLSRDGFHAVGEVPGLGLDMSADARSWLLRYSFGGRRPQMGLGSFPEVSLALARQKARDARELVREGINPTEARESAKRAAAAKSAASKTFGECATQYIDAKLPEWSNIKHAGQWRTTIETFAMPVIGKMSVQDVDTPHVMSILEPIWQTKTETAVRLRGRLESILDWATVRGYRAGQGRKRGASRRPASRRDAWVHGTTTCRQWRKRRGTAVRDTDRGTIGRGARGQVARSRLRRQGVDCPFRTHEGKEAASRAAVGGGNTTAACKA